LLCVLIAGFLVREKRFVFWLIALLIVVALNLPLPATLAVRAGMRSSVTPFQNTMSLVVFRMRNIFSGVGRSAQIAIEKRELEIEVATLRSELLRLKRFKDENCALRRQLGFAVLSPRKLLLSEVISRGDISGWWHTLRLNKGFDAGVERGMAVISNDGLVGRVASVTKRTCDVLLIIDSGCKVACKVVRNGAFGIMQGSGIAMDGGISMEMLASVKPAVLDYVSTEHELQPRDIIHTSGLGNVFPEGLPVGRLGAIKMDSSGLYQQAEVIPSADIDRLKYAFIVVE